MMTRRTDRRARGWATRARMLVVVPALAAPAFVAGAQSNLSGQGFGFPSGQFSTRAQGTGGAIGEMDPFSPINPASDRKLPDAHPVLPDGAGVPQRVDSVGVRNAPPPPGIPWSSARLPVGNNLVVSLSASSLLDRTSTTSFKSTQIISGGEAVPMTTTFRISGGMEDVRLAAAWTPRSWLRVGAGLHAITGSNLIDLTQSFADSVRFAAFTQQRILGFNGTAGSIGVQFLSSQVVASASGRFGRQPAPVRRGHAAGSGQCAQPVRRLDRLRRHCELGDLGPNLARELVGARLPRHPGADRRQRVGHEHRRRLCGPQIGDRIVFLRGGYRHRTLPFQALTRTVTENSFSGGTGTAFANGRVLTDLALIRSSRSADLPASEHAWTISFGISVRP